MKLRSWFINGLLVVIGVVGALAVTETGLRLFAPLPTGLAHQDRSGLAMHWPSMKRKLPQYGTTASFNSAGMRDREHGSEKPAGVYRILLFGDSFMEALQVEFEQSMPSLLEGMLSQGTGKKIEVISAGVSGWGTADQLRYLTEYGLRYQPDLVLIAMTLHNDVSDNMREEWFTLRNDSLLAREVFPVTSSRYFVVQAKAYIATRFQSYQLWRKVRHRGGMRRVGEELNKHIVELFREPPSEALTRGYRLTDQLLQRTDSVTRANGARLALALLPLQVQLSDSAFHEFVAQAGARAAEMPLEKPQRLVLATALRIGAPAVDLLPAFRARTARDTTSLYMIGDGHWNAAGHRLAAETVAEGLLRAGVIP